MENQHFNIKSINYSSINVIEITGSTTYTKPDNLLYSRIVCVGGGGGGGSGRIAGTTNTMSGGSGGGGGALASRILLYSDLPLTPINIIIGSGGTGGAAKNGAAQNGANGTIGGDTSFDNFVIAAGGQNGLGGLVTAVAGGDGGDISNCIPFVYGLSFNGIAGGTGNIGNGGGITTVPGVNYGGCGMINGICTGGGGGGGCVTTTVNGIGGAGGRAITTSVSLSPIVAGGTLSGGTGTTGESNVSLQILEQYPMTTPLNTLGIGLGGSGGGSSKYSGNPGGDGGNGGLYGAGGAGGGCGLVGGAPNGSGKGGDGGQGLCIIVEYLR